MRPALLAIPLLLACGGSSAGQSSPPPERPHDIRPAADSAGPMAWKCRQSAGRSEVAAPRRSEPELEAKKTVPDAVEAAPLVYKVVVENDEVRVLSATYKPDTVVPMHRHPDRVVFVLDSGNASFEPAGTHEVAVATATREVIVELGAKPGVPRPDGDEPVATYPRIFKLVLDEPRVRVLDVTFGKGTSRPVALGDHVLVARNKGTLIVTPKGGTARSLHLEPGKVEFFPAGVYNATNARRESFEVILFELK